MLRRTLSLLAAALIAQSARSTPPAPTCSPAASSPTVARALDDAIAAVVPSIPRDAVALIRATRTTSCDYQSDRTYPPYLRAQNIESVYVDAASGIETVVWSGSDGVTEGSTRVTTSGRRGTYALRDTAWRAAPPARNASERARALDPWAMLADWSADTAHIRVAGRCVFRDQPRLTLERSTAIGAERLYLDEETSFPVGMTRTEPHYLWGQVDVSYVWSTWLAVAGGYFPIASFRSSDGTEDLSRIVALTPAGDPSLQLAARSSVPGAALSNPSAEGAEMLAATPGFLDPVPPDTARVAPNVAILHNRGYTEAAVLAGDTLFVLDATQGEKRAMADEAALRGMFPRPRAVTVISTDLAWPHIAGVRYWVARRARIVGHAFNVPLLSRVTARRWTVKDSLERAGHPRASIVGVRERMSFANGAVRVAHLDGAAGEGALLVYVPSAHFLWASDYIQSVEQGTLYLDDGARAIRREGWCPEIVAAQHIPVTKWSKLQPLVHATAVAGADKCRTSGGQ